MTLMRRRVMESKGKMIMTLLRKRMGMMMMRVIMVMMTLRKRKKRRRRRDTKIMPCKNTETHREKMAM